MTRKTITVLSLLLMIRMGSFSQSVENSHKHTKVCNLVSSEVLDEGILQISVSGRFGEDTKLSNYYSGSSSQFSIDAAIGFTKGAHVGVKYETLRKTTTGYGKLQLANEQAGSTISAALYGSMSLNSELSSSEFPRMKYPDRLSYSTQLILSKRILKNVRVLLTPSIVRQNLVWEPTQNHNQMVLASGATFYLDEQVSLNFDYAYNFNRTDNSTYKNPFSIGIKKQLNQNLFELIVSNSQADNAPSIMSNADGDWKTLNMFLGFGFSRNF